MADTSVAFPRYGQFGGQTVAIKAVDLLDGTYSLGASTGTASGVTIAFPSAGSFGGQVVPINTVDNGDGTYSIKISG